MALLRLARPLPIESAMNRLSLDLAGLIYLGATFHSSYFFEIDLTVSGSFSSP